MFNLTVTRGHYRNGASPNIGRKMLEERRAQKQAEIDAQLKQIAAKEAYNREVNEQNKFFVDRARLSNMKAKAIGKLGRLYPTLIISEAYAMIVANALPHTEDFVIENFSSILANQFLYLHNIGGIETVKRRAIKEHSTFLTKLYKIATENSKDILERKIHEIQNAKSVEDLRKASQLDLTEDEHSKISKDLSTLSTDELADLINKKVVQVVKDESDREKDNRAFIEELKSAVAEKEDESTEPEEAQESSLSTIAKLSKYILNKGEIKESSLFAAMMYRNTQHYGNLKSVFESTEDDNTVLTSPLNMNMMDIYLKDTSGDLADIDFLKVSVNEPLGGDDTRLDESDIDLNNSFEAILSETIVQYTMLEAVTTTKLVSISRQEIKDFSHAIMKK